MARLRTIRSCPISARAGLEAALDDVIQLASPAIQRRSASISGKGLGDATSRSSPRRGALARRWTALSRRWTDLALNLDWLGDGCSSVASPVLATTVRRRGVLRGRAPEVLSRVPSSWTAPGPTRAARARSRAGLGARTHARAPPPARAGLRPQPPRDRRPRRRERATGIGRRNRHALARTPPVPPCRGRKSRARAHAAAAQDLAPSSWAGDGAMEPDHQRPATPSVRGGASRTADRSATWTPGSPRSAARAPGSSAASKRGWTSPGTIAPPGELAGRRRHPPRGPGPVTPFASADAEAARPGRRRGDLA